MLDDDLDLRVVHDGEGVLADASDALDAYDRIRLIGACRGVGDLDSAPRPASDLTRVPGQNGHRPAADRSHAQQTDLYRFHQSLLSSCPYTTDPTATGVTRPTGTRAGTAL